MIALKFHETGEIYQQRSIFSLLECDPETEIVCADIIELAQHYAHNGELHTKPDQPTPAHTWNWTTKTWDLDLTLAKDQAWARIKQARAAALNAPLSTTHGTFDGDPVSQQNILKAALDAKTRHELGMPSDVGFTLADNTRPTFTMLQMLDVAMAMGNREKAAYATAQTLREQIDAATTPEQLEAIQWPASS